MPIDVQPISPARRASLLVVLLVLFLVSLGAAHEIIQLHSKETPPPTPRDASAMPLDTFSFQHPSTEFVQDDSGSKLSSEAKISLRSTINGNARYFYLLAGKPQELTDMTEFASAATQLFALNVGVTPQSTRPSTLGQYPSLNLTCRINQTGFVWGRAIYADSCVYLLLYAGGSGALPQDNRNWEILSTPTIHIRGNPN